MAHKARLKQLKLAAVRRAVLKAGLATVPVAGVQVIFLGWLGPLWCYALLFIFLTWLTFRADRSARPDAPRTLRCGGVVPACEVGRATTGQKERLCGQCLPDDFVALATYEATLNYVRDNYTNCATLIRSMPACPADCRVAGRWRELTEGVCGVRWGYCRSLESFADEIAKDLYNEWVARKPSSGAALEVAHEGIPNVAHDRTSNTSQFEVRPSEVGD